MEHFQTARNIERNRVLTGLTFAVKFWNFNNNSYSILIIENGNYETIIIFGQPILKLHQCVQFFGAPSPLEQKKNKEKLRINQEIFH